MFDFHSRLGKCLLGQWLNFKLFGITYYLVGKIQFKLLFEGPLAKWEWWQACRRRHAAEPQNTCPFYFSKRDLFRFNLSFFWGKFMLLPSGLVFLNFLAWIGWSFFVGGGRIWVHRFCTKEIQRSRYPPGNDDHISHLWKRNIIFKSTFERGYVSSLEGIFLRAPISKVYFFDLSTEDESEVSCLNSKASSQISNYWLTTACKFKDDSSPSILMHCYIQVFQ